MMVDLPPPARTNFFRLLNVLDIERGRERVLCGAFPTESGQCIVLHTTAKLNFFLFFNAATPFVCLKWSFLAV